MFDNGSCAVWTTAASTGDSKASVVGSISIALVGIRHKVRGQPSQRTLEFAIRQARPQAKDLVAQVPNRRVDAVNDLIRPVACASWQGGARPRHWQTHSEPEQRLDHPVVHFSGNALVFLAVRGGPTAERT